MKFVSLYFATAALAIIAFAAGFELPEEFLGIWAGEPNYGILGPFPTDSYVFSISKTLKGDYLLEDNIIYDHQMIGYQRFYVEGYGDTSGTLWYCGAFSNFSDYTEETGEMRLNEFMVHQELHPSETESNKVTFCFNSNDPKAMNPARPFKVGCKGCECGNWTMEYQFDTSTQSHILTSQLTMSGESRHMWAKLTRIADPPPVSDADMPGHGSNFSCDFSEGGRDSEPIDRSVQLNDALKHYVKGQQIDMQHRRISSETQAGNVDAASILVLETLTVRSEEEIENSFMQAHHAIKDMKAMSLSNAQSSCPFSLRHPSQRNPKKDSQLNMKIFAETKQINNSNEAKVSMSDTDSYEHCYVLNEVVDYRIQWTLDEVNQLLHCSISVPVVADDASSSSSTTTWAAVGFRPLSRVTGSEPYLENTGRTMNFAMAGADIVVGSVGSGVRTMYAKEYTGAPILDNSLDITNTSVSILPATITPSNEDNNQFNKQLQSQVKSQRVVVSFTRPLVGGYLLKNFGNNASIATPYADIIWATGQDDSSDSSTCGYHENSRGLRVIDWADPEIAMVDAWKCKY